MKQNLKSTAFHCSVIFSYSKSSSEGLTTPNSQPPYARSSLISSACGSRQSGTGMLAQAPHISSTPAGEGRWGLILVLCHGRGPSLWCHSLSDELQPALGAITVAGWPLPAGTQDTVWAGSVEALSGLMLDCQPRGSGSTPPQLLHHRLT